MPSKKKSESKVKNSLILSKDDVRSEWNVIPDRHLLNNDSNIIIISKSSDEISGKSPLKVCNYFVGELKRISLTKNKKQCDDP